ncbi:MAG: four helix bundle protein [Lewinellaceae bacterium]|nr:four helix bundle protein [Lewinellaceae bacterium]
MRNFRELRVWSDSLAFAASVFKAIEQFPKSERYGLSNQLSSAVVSIASNIAEGCSRSTGLEFSRFLEYSIGSSFETETQLLLAQKFGYISETECNQLLEALKMIQRSLNKLHSSVKISRALPAKDQ